MLFTVSLGQQSACFVLPHCATVRNDNSIIQLHPGHASTIPPHRMHRGLHKYYCKEEMVVDEEDDLKARMKKEGKLRALWNKYGALYFQVWFCIYLPFLLSFFYVLDNNLLQASVFESIDPKAAVLDICTRLESAFGDPELMKGVRENPRVTNFATAYLLADLVPTTVFALGVVTFITKKRDKAALDLINRNEGGNTD